MGLWLACWDGYAWDGFLICGHRDDASRIRSTCWLSEGFDGYRWDEAFEYALLETYSMRPTWKLQRLMRVLGVKRKYLRDLPGDFSICSDLTSTIHGHMDIDDSYLFQACCGPPPSLPQEPPFSRKPSRLSINQLVISW